MSGPSTPLRRRLLLLLPRAKSMTNTIPILISTFGTANLIALACIARHACRQAQGIKRQITAEAANTQAHTERWANRTAFIVKNSEQAVLDAFIPHADKLHATVE